MWYWRIIIFMCIPHLWNQSEVSSFMASSIGDRVMIKPNIARFFFRCIAMGFKRAVHASRLHARVDNSRHNNDTQMKSCGNPFLRAIVGRGYVYSHVPLNLVLKVWQHTVVVQKLFAGSMIASEFPTLHVEKKSHKPASPEFCWAYPPEHWPNQAPWMFHELHLLCAWPLLTRFCSANTIQATRLPMQLHQAKWRPTGNGRQLELALVCRTIECEVESGPENPTLCSTKLPRQPAPVRRWFCNNI